MEKFIVKGGRKLQGTVTVSGAKNVVGKLLVASVLTGEEVTIHNIPLISDCFALMDIVREIGGEIRIKDHTAFIRVKDVPHHEVSLEKAALTKTSSMFLAPLLARAKEAIVPNPGGCRIGARPIDRTIRGLEALGAEVTYFSEDGYFHAKAPEGLKGATFTFDKTTHTGTETIIIAAVLAKGTTILKNAALEPEIDELIGFLNALGAKVKRTGDREIEIQGVEKLHGAEFTVASDRNEIVTFAVAALVTKGDIFINGAKRKGLIEFLEKLGEIGAGVEEKEEGIRFFWKGPLKATDITTSPYPGFMTDWQSVWAVLMTQAEGTSVVHETVFENRFGYVSQLRKMGAVIRLFNPEIEKPAEVYNFNLEDTSDSNKHAVRIYGPKNLHNGVVTISDLRAGATLVIGALTAKGQSIIFGLEQVDRGYEKFDERLRSLGADIKRLRE